MTAEPHSRSVYYPDKDLLYFEQQVNDRFRAADAPAIDRKYLPENNESIPLAWRSVPVAEAKFFATSRFSVQEMRDQFVRDGRLLMPVHPLDEPMFRDDELIRYGTIRFSASYRTVAYQPDPEGPLFDWIPSGQVLMMKLHLDEQLPGIPGDRRLTPDRIDKCVTLSEVLAREVSRDEFAEHLEIVPEFFGMSCRGRGMLLRLLPSTGVLPAFSLYSRDRMAIAEPPIIVSRLRVFYGTDSIGAARGLGENLARPLMRSMLAGFRAGFSMEMHAQNVLVSLGTDRLLHHVLFRDLEGVIFSNAYRESRGRTPLFSGSANKELVWSGRSMRRWYNRNLDHDLGRIFDGAISAARNSGYFDDQAAREAIRSIRYEVNLAAQEADVQSLHMIGRLLPFSRAPWGNGSRLGHYFRSRYR